jgi:hypothetical protein
VERGACRAKEGYKRSMGRQRKRRAGGKRMRTFTEKGRKQDEREVIHLAVRS